MWKLLTVLAFGVFASHCLAQDAVPRNELGLGFSFAHARMSASGDRSTLPGFQFDYTRNVNKWIGVTGEFTGHYHCLTGCWWDSSLSREKAFVFAVGPRFTLRNKSKITPWTHVLAGVANVSTSDDIQQTNDSSTGCTFIAGGGLDYKLSHGAAAIRLIQVDLLRHPVGSQVRNDLRFGFGVSFGFGGTSKRKK